MNSQRRQAILRISGAQGAEDPVSPITPEQPARQLSRRARKDPNLNGNVTITCGKIVPAKSGVGVPLDSHGRIAFSAEGQRRVRQYVRVL